MQNSLTKLHEQFQRKHHQLAQITGKIDTFMQFFRPRADSKKTVRAKLKALRDGLKGVKEQFQVVKQDLVTYGQLPSQFVRMVVELPGIYQGFWEGREEGLKRVVSVKEEENLLLKQKLQAKEQQILRLKRQLQPKITPTQPQNHSKVEKIAFKIPQLKPQPRKDLKMQEQQDLDEYINNMEITIRENDDPLFKKITEQGSQEQQEEQQEESCDYTSRVDHKNITARSNILLDCSDQAVRMDQIRKKSQSSFLYQNKDNYKNSNKTANKPLQLITKHIFWNKLSKNLSATSKQKSKKTLSQSKQNIDNKSINKLTIAEKKVLTSKITDFRKLLFAEKGLQRLAFRLQ